MKKNITINMLGVLYNIDEDAYELLNQYLDGMKEYFARHGDDGEIAQDIEYRIAELLNEMKTNGKNVITIEDVTHICQQVGKPEEMDTEENEGEDLDSDSTSSTHSTESTTTTESTEQEETKTTSGKRKLYRNTDDKMLGGVLSGLAQYATGGDPLPWRIAFVLLVLIGVPFVSSQFLLLGYLLAWIIIPGLSTPEDRLRMRGEEVSTENVQRELLNPAPQSNNSNSSANGCLTALVWIFKIGLILVLGFIGISLLMTLLMAAMAVPMLTLIPGFAMVAPFFDGMFSIPWVTTVLAVCGLIVIVVPIGFLLHALIAKRSSSWTTRLVAALIWLAALLAIVYTVNEAQKVHVDHPKEFRVNLPGFNFRINSNGINMMPSANWQDEIDSLFMQQIDTTQQQPLENPEDAEEIFPE